MLLLRQLLLFGLFTGFFSSVFAASPLQFEDAWSPEAPPVAPVMAGYVKISNTTQQSIAITAASCPDFNQVEIHDMQHKDGMMHMVKQDQLPIPAGQQVALQPGGMHLMLIQPKRTIKAGETLQVTFELSDGSSVTVPFTVKVRAMQGDHMQMQHN